ncbi:MAG: hypothetical protein LBN21_03955 [Treponema sp.]|jgi:hypothetical protein|nr:hypothetical protein [Treponema sp.]
MAEQIADTEEFIDSPQITLARERSIFDESFPGAFIRAFGSPYLRMEAAQCIWTVLDKFFFLQYRTAFLPGRVPVSRVDHPLDEKIPFVPSWITVYLDFIGFWIRIISFLLRVYGRKALSQTKIFIQSIKRLYLFAVEVYEKNFSTTNRPFYISRPKFFTIHLTDPHLMCIPSLHVMIVIRVYTDFARMMHSNGDEKRFARRTEELRKGALAITEAVLYVKQHSVNCVAAAMYAMTCFDRELFPEEEAVHFASSLFQDPDESAHPAKPKNGARVKPEDGIVIRSHMISLYRRFLSERDETKHWGEPLLNFLRNDCLQK